MSAPGRQPTSSSGDDEAAVSSTTGDFNDLREQADYDQRDLGITIQRTENNQNRVMHPDDHGSQRITTPRIEGNNNRDGNHGVIQRLLITRARNARNGDVWRIVNREDNGREAMPAQRNGRTRRRRSPREDYRRILSLPHKMEFGTWPPTTDTLNCDYCHQLFETVSEMREHMTSPFHRAACMGCTRLHEGNSHSTQERVLSSFPEKILLMDPDTPDSHICTTCNEVFKSVAGMRLHRTKMHLMKNQSLQCTGCHEIFPKIKDFKRHKRKCLREPKDKKGITEGNTATNSSVSTEQSHSSANRTEITAPSHSRNAAPAETAHSDSSHISVPSQTPDNWQQLPKKWRRRPPPEPEPDQEVPSAENNIQQPEIKEASSSPFVLDMPRNLLLCKKDKKTLNSCRRAKMSSTPQHEQVEEQNFLLSGGNYRVIDPCHSRRRYKKKRKSQLLQDGSSLLKKRKCEGYHGIDSTAGPAHMASATVGSQFALKGCHVVLPDIGSAGEKSSLFDTEEQTEQPEPKEMERAYNNREGQDTNCNEAQLATLLDTKNACSFTDNHIGEETGDQQLSDKDLVKQVPVEDKESEVRDILPHNKCMAISNQTTDCDISVPTALYTGETATNSELSLGNNEVTNVASFDGTRAEYTEDSDNQMPTDNSYLPTPEDPEKENTVQCINRKADKFISVNSITDTLAANENYRNKQYPTNRLNESSPANESFTILAEEQDEHPLEGCESDDSLQYSLSGTNSSVQNLSICDDPSQAEMLQTTELSSKVQPNRTENFRDAITQSASNHCPSVSQSSPHHIMINNEENDLCIGSLAQYYTDNDRQIFSNTFFDEILSQGPTFKGEISEEQCDLSPSLNTSDTNDISYNLSTDCAREQENSLNHFRHSEETGFHSTDNESCISLGSVELQQKNTFQNSFFLADQCDTVNDEKTLYKSVLVEKIKDSEIPKLIFDDNCICETSESTLDEEEIYLTKINDWERKTDSNPEIKKANEAQDLPFNADSNDKMCVSQTHASSKSQSINTYKIQDNEADLIDIFLSYVNHDGIPSNDGSNQETSNTDTIKEDGDLTHDNVMKLITNGREESNCSNGNEGRGELHSHNSRELSDWLEKSIDTEFFLSSDDSQFVDDCISENSLGAVSNSGTTSNPATDNTSKIQVLTDGYDWSPLTNNFPLFPDLPLNPKDSPDHGIDLTFDQPADTEDCGTIDEFLRELISSKFPHLMDQDFAESGSADEAANDSGLLSFEALDFDVLLATLPDLSDWITKPEMAVEKEKIGTDSERNPEPSMIEHNEVLVHEAGSNMDNLETVNGIGCSTENYNMCTNNNVADSTLTEIAGETHANYTEQATDSREADNNNFTHCKPGATEIIPEGSEDAVLATKSPSEQVVKYSDIKSTESAQYNMEMDMNPPDQDTIVSFIDSLTNFTPSCSTSQYREASGDASYHVVTEYKETPIHWKNTASSNGITYEVEKFSVVNADIQKKAKCNSSHFGTCTVSSPKVNLSKNAPEICGAQKHHHGDSEINMITKSSDLAENIPLEQSLAKTAICRPVLEHTSDVQPITRRDDERIQQKGGMPQRGYLAGTSNGKSNKILQTEEILTFSLLSPQQAAQGTSGSQSGDLSHTKESQHKGSAARNTCQIDNKSQFTSIKANSVPAIQRNPLAHKSQEALLVNLVPVQTNSASDGKTVVVNKQGRAYMWVAPMERAQPVGNTTSTNLLAKKTFASRSKCHCGRLFQTVRSLHHHQTRCHIRTQLVHEVSKGKCDRMVHSLPHSRYECPCGIIFRSAPAAFNCCLGGASQQLTLCKCKFPKRRPRPSSLHKPTGRKANKEILSQLQMSENSTAVKPSHRG